MHKAATKIIFCLLTFIVVYFTSCNTTYQLASKTETYDNSVDFTIEKVVEGKSIAIGNGSRNATKGYKFVMLTTLFKNNSLEKRHVDLTDFYLLEPKKHVKYILSFAMIESFVNMGANTDFDISKNDTKRRRLIFVYPEKEKAMLMSVKDSTFTITYREGTAKAN
jgi:hypothetical protein